MPPDAPREKVGRPYEGKDDNEYRVVHVTTEQHATCTPRSSRGATSSMTRAGSQYKTDIPIARESKNMDNQADAPRGFDAPQPELFRSIIEGILSGTLEWSLFIVGVLIAVALELAGIRALPFAVGMYIPLSSTTPIFIGGGLALADGQAAWRVRIANRKRKRARACCCPAATSPAAP